MKAAGLQILQMLKTLQSNIIQRLLVPQGLHCLYSNVATRMFKGILENLDDGIKTVALDPAGQRKGLRSSSYS